MNNVLQSLSNHLIQDIRTELENQMVQELLNGIETQIREKVKPLVENITLAHVEQYRDIMHMRECLHITVKMEE